MKKYATNLLRLALIIFVLAIAFSPIFTNLAELDSVTLTPLGYLPIALRADNTATPTITPTPTNTIPSPANVKITFIEYNPPGNDVDGEFIEITNLGGTAQNIKNWYIKPTTFSGAGESDKVLHDPFNFPDHTLEPGSFVRVWTKIGINSPPNFYWNATSQIWLNDGDVARLFDNNDQLIDICNYAGGGQNTTCDD